MTMPIKEGTCPHCDNTFDKLFAHQKFCDVHCAFWSRVDPLHSSLGDHCWPWTGSTTAFGYGEFNYNGKLLRTHRVSYELHYGPLEPGQSILHHCDNPPCVRPTHLYSGSQKDNLRDAAKRGRMLKKLTLEQVDRIERRLWAGESPHRIAKDYPVTHENIYAKRRRMIRDRRL